MVLFNELTKVLLYKYKINVHQNKNIKHRVYQKKKTTTIMDNEATSITVQKGKKRIPK